MGLLERRPRVGCVIGTLILAPLLGLGAATIFGVWDPPEPIPAPLAERAFAREVQANRSIGLALESEGSEALRGGSTERSLPIAMQPGECVGVTAAAWGFFDAHRIAIADAAGRELAVAEQQFAIARTVQWCSTSAQTLTARIELQSADVVLGREQYQDGHVRWEVDRGRPPLLHASLVRGAPTIAGARSVPRATLLAHASSMARSYTPIGSPIEIAAHRARLVPETSAVYGRLHTRADNGRGDPVTPRWDPLPADVPASWRPQASFGQLTSPIAITTGRQTQAQGAHPAIAFRDGTAYRVLAIVEPRAFGGCVRVQLVRLLWGYGTEAGRFDRRPVTRERNVILDRSCEHELQEYVAPADDHETYLLRLFAG